MIRPTLTVAARATHCRANLAILRADLDRFERVIAEVYDELNVLTRQSALSAHRTDLRAEFKRRNDRIAALRAELRSLRVRKRYARTLLWRAERDARPLIAEFERMRG